MIEKVIKIVGLGLNLSYRMNPDWAVHQAVKLFSLPQKRSTSAEREAFLETAQKSIRRTFGDRELQVYIWSGGPRTILLAHGWESGAGRWHELIPKLVKNGFTGIALDAPGHGHSQGRLYDQNVYGEAIRSLAVEFKVKAIVGHSLGGFTLLMEYYRKPIPGVQKLIFMGTPMGFNKFQKGFQRSVGLNRMFGEDFEHFFSEKYKIDLVNFSFLNVREGFKIPVLFIHDQEDKIVDYQPTAQVAHQWKNAELLTTHGVGHGLRGPQVYSTIIDFLTKEKEE